MVKNAERGEGGGGCGRDKQVWGHLPKRLGLWVLASILDCGRLCDLPPKWKDWQMAEGHKNGAQLVG